MNPAGVLLIVVGVWVGTQVLAGNALGRLGLIPAGGGDAATSNAGTGVGGAAAGGARIAGELLNDHQR